MELRGITFAPVSCSSGGRNFTGRGWPHHALLKRVNLLDYGASTLVSKTVTLHPRPGNMPLRNDGLTPVDRNPDCVVIKFFKGVVLNAVGLSNHGAKWLINHPHLREPSRPFFLSFAIDKDSVTKPLPQVVEFMGLLQKRPFRTPFGPIRPTSKLLLPKYRSRPGRDATGGGSSSDVTW